MSSYQSYSNFAAELIALYVDPANQALSLKGLMKIDVAIY